MVSGGNTTDYVLDGQSVVRTLLNGTVDRTYLHGPRGPEYERVGTNAPVWYLYDGLGSVVGTVDGQGNLVSTRKYDVYGAVRGSTGTGTSNHKFVGQLGHPSEDETGLIYMRARYYDPVTGRFASEDRARDGVNWFQYADANPVCRYDRSGLSSGTALETEIATGEGAALTASNAAVLGILKGKATELALLLTAKYAALGQLVAAGYTRGGDFAWQFKDAAGRIHLFRFDVANGLLKHTSSGSNLGIPHHLRFADLLKEIIDIFGP